MPGSWRVASANVWLSNEDQPAFSDHGVRSMLSARVGIHHGSQLIKVATQKGAYIATARDGGQQVDSAQQILAGPSLQESQRKVEDRMPPPDIARPSVSSG